MTIDDIKKISVIGSGTMGSQISMVCALAGYQVAVHDIKEEQLARARKDLEGHMNRWVEKKRITEEEKNAAFSRMTFTTSLEEAVQETDYVIEAVLEVLELKRDVFAQLDKLAPKHTILATNSSFLQSSLLADVTTRPDKVCNVHFFAPVLVMELVEVVKGPHTSDETAEISMELCRRINKHPILIRQEIEGFVVNRILKALMDEAISLYEKGIASFEDIDIACMKGLNHPIGPFALMDLSGIDVGYYAAMNRYNRTKDPKDLPQKIIREKVEKGELGRKTGKGFYDYTKK